MGVELAVFKRQNQRRRKLGTRRYIADLPPNDYDVIENIPDYLRSAEYDFAKLFEPVALRVAQALDREATVEQVQWVVHDESLMFALRALRKPFAERTRRWSALTAGERVGALLLTAHVGQMPTNDIRGFVFCDSPAHLPQVNEKYLLLNDAQSSALFTWQTGKFSVTELNGRAAIDLGRIKRVGYIAELNVGEQSSNGAKIVSFSSAEMIHDLALTHHLMWRPALAPWEIAVRQRKLTELRAAVAALERENRELTSLLERMKRVVQEVVKG